MAADHDLLRPTLGAHTARPAGAPKPWELSHQLYVAFLGGAAAAGLIAVLNARRLGIGERVQAAIVALAVVGFAASVGLAAATSSDLAQVAARGLGLAAWGGMWLLQRTPARLYDYASRDAKAHESLLAPGLAAVLGGALVQSMAITAVTGR